MYNNVLDYVYCAVAKTNNFTSRKYWAQQDHYEFNDRLAILWNQITSKFEKYGDPIGQNIYLEHYKVKLMLIVSVGDQCLVNCIYEKLMLNTALQ